MWNRARDTILLYPTAKSVSYNVETQLPGLRNCTRLAFRHFPLWILFLGSHFSKGRNENSFRALTHFIRPSDFFFSSLQLILEVSSRPSPPLDSSYKTHKMTTRSANLNHRPSMQSLGGGRGSPGLTSATSRPFRPCADCTCSPGLLSRAGRRSSLFLRQLENNRRRSSRELTGGNAGGSQESVYSSDSLCVSTREVNTTQRLLALRRKMVEHDLCCYVVPSEDEHQSEYVSPADQRRAFISGFNGSAGVACITRDLLNFNTDEPEGKSVLSTDGRYFNQASQELDYNWTLLRQGVDPVTWQEWCVKEAAEMSRGLGGKTTAKIGVDPRLMSYEQVVQFHKLIKSITAKTAKGDTTADVQLVPVDENLIDAIWPKFEHPPKKELKSVTVLPLKYTGETSVQKRSRLVTLLNKKHGGLPLAVVALDEVCWLLNLRGSDIPYNPVFYGYAVIDPSPKGEENTGTITLFTDNPLGAEVQHYCAENGVQVEPYANIWQRLAGRKFLVPDNASWQIVRRAEDTEPMHSPVDLFKSVKNTAEINNARAAQVKDGVALAQYFAWLEDQLIKKGALIDEHRAALKLSEIRRTQKGYQGDSFETISSTGANAAIIHYAPPAEGSAMINPDKIYLCDSGAQYLQGTTDITRTLHLTHPTKEQRHRYTLVLKGHLALERLVFPEGTTTGFHIDALARQALWAEGLDYRHGTGHGIGSFLNVHEGPVGIGPRAPLLKYALQEGNLLSNEPGYYKDGEYGIRIESDMLVTRSEHARFLRFENLTVVPYCHRLIDTSLLTREELRQVNSYHAHVWRTVAPLLQPQCLAHKWLKRETAEM